MNIGEKYLDFATGAKEMSELDLTPIVRMRPPGYFLCDAYHRHEVGAVRSVMSEIGFLERSFDAPTDQWSQYLESLAISVDICLYFAIPQ